MSDIGGLLMVGLLVTLAGAAALSYRKHMRAARSRSRAALNRLLAEAYDPTDTPDAGHDPGDPDPGAPPGPS